MGVVVVCMSRIENEELRLKSVEGTGRDVTGSLEQKVREDATAVEYKGMKQSVKASANISCVSTCNTVPVNSDKRFDTALTRTHIHHCMPRM